jgi:hypothetical protein
VFHVYDDKFICVLYTRRVTYRHQLEVLKFAAPTGTFKRLLDAQAHGADAVGDIDHPGQFLQLYIELGRDSAITRGTIRFRIVDQRDLLGRVTDAEGQ